MRSRNMYEDLDEVLSVAAPPDPEKFPLTTRSVERRIEGGNAIGCLVCGIALKFVATQKQNQIISNVYGVEGNWLAVVAFHPSCYEDIGQPLGVPSTEPSKVSR